MVYDRAFYRRKNRRYIRKWGKLCALANHLLRNDPQENWDWLIIHCETNGRPELRQLKIALEPHWDTFSLRCQNYKLGLLGRIMEPIYGWMYLC